MSSIVLTIHNLDSTYAGFSASEIRSSSCHHFRPSGRRSGRIFINEARDRHLRNISASQFRELCERSAEVCGGNAAIVVDPHVATSTRAVLPNVSNPKFSEVRL
jgi:hypothetical protein